jgi:hypothetical protein
MEMELDRKVRVTGVFCQEAVIGQKYCWVKFSIPLPVARRVCEDVYFRMAWADMLDRMIVRENQS